MNRHGRNEDVFLPEHPPEEGPGRLDLLVGLGHQLHGLLLLAGVVHGDLRCDRREKRARCSAVDGEERREGE